MQNLKSGYLSIITIHELTYGIELKPDGRNKDRLSKAVSTMLTAFKDQIIPIQQLEAVRAGQLRAKSHSEGRTVHMADAMIAATADIHSLILVTRNTRDFKGLGVLLLNPWEESYF
jgi:predicted nucleic acid-binding protein